MLGMIAQTVGAPTLSNHMAYHPYESINGAESHSRPGDMMGACKGRPDVLNPERADPRVL